MFKVGCVSAVVLLALALGAFSIGLGSQQPGLFAIAILCFMPLGAFFSGGALFTFFGEYELPKRRVKDKQAATAVNRARANLG